jgi:hypothetical protein
MTQEITILTKEDKKLVMQGFSLGYYKAFHFVFAILYVIALLIITWKFSRADCLAVTGLFAWLLLVFNFLFLLDYLFHSIQMMGAKKMIITGTVTDKYESGTENGGTIVCFGTNKFDITWARKTPDFLIGDTIRLNYVSTKNGKRGSLISVEKL